ncbi:hypothetical protein CJU90_6610 [Yarrowia sp. C11]|nr:hypothetical protein CJU90_6610 [Yarrowia sp. C11]KAG5358721.1 hypothetical protein CKK34_4987 [Yarrowia sp. E02]
MIDTRAFTYESEASLFLDHEHQKVEEKSTTRNFGRKRGLILSGGFITLVSLLTLVSLSTSAIPETATSSDFQSNPESATSSGFQSDPKTAISAAISLSQVETSLAKIKPSTDVVLRDTNTALIERWQWLKTAWQWIGGGAGAALGLASMAATIKGCYDTYNQPNGWGIASCVIGILGLVGTLAGGVRVAISVAKPIWEIAKLIGFILTYKRALSSLEDSHLLGQNTQVVLDTSHKQLAASGLHTIGLSFHGQNSTGTIRDHIGTDDQGHHIKLTLHDKVNDVSYNLRHYGIRQQTNGTHKAVMALSHQSLTKRDYRVGDTTEDIVAAFDAGVEPGSEDNIYNDVWTVTGEANCYLNPNAHADGTYAGAYFQDYDANHHATMAAGVVGFCYPGWNADHWYSHREDDIGIPIIDHCDQ